LNQSKVFSHAISGVQPASAPPNTVAKIGLLVLGGDISRAICYCPIPYCWIRIDQIEEEVKVFSDSLDHLFAFQAKPASLTHHPAL